MRSLAPYVLIRRLSRIVLTMGIGICLISSTARAGVITYTFVGANMKDSAGDTLQITGAFNYDPSTGSATPDDLTISYTAADPFGIFGTVVVVVVLTAYVVETVAGPFLDVPRSEMFVTAGGASDETAEDEPSGDSFSESISFSDYDAGGDDPVFPGAGCITTTGSCGVSAPEPSSFTILGGAITLLISATSLIRMKKQRRMLA